MSASPALPSSDATSRELLPIDIQHAVRRAPSPGAAEMLAVALEAAVGGRSHPTSVTASVADAVTRVIDHLTATPSRFIAAEDEVVRALLSAHAEWSAIERVLTDFEEIYIARWR